MLNVGDRAPSFSLRSTNGSTRTLEDFRGQKVVLYFYPKDETPGCTIEACDFRDNFARITGHGAVVLGVSKDSIESHQKFASNHNLPFELLFDPDNTVQKTYGAWGLKNMYGNMVEGTIRSTFLIDEEGLIMKVWSPVKVEGHVNAVIGELDPSWVATTKAPATKPMMTKTTTKPAKKAKPKARTSASPRASGRGKKTTKPATKKGGKAKKKVAKKKASKKK
jgi:thioredoxin-dependent peroxiredoxin